MEKGTLTARAQKRENKLRHCLFLGKMGKLLVWHTCRSLLKCFMGTETGRHHLWTFPLPCSRLLLSPRNPVYSSGTTIFVADTRGYLLITGLWWPVSLVLLGPEELSQIKKLFLTRYLKHSAHHRNSWLKDISSQFFCKRGPLYYHHNCGLWDKLTIKYTSGVNYNNYNCLSRLERPASTIFMLSICPTPGYWCLSMNLVHKSGMPVSVAVMYKRNYLVAWIWWLVEFVFIGSTELWLTKKLFLIGYLLGLDAKGAYRNTQLPADLLKKSTCIIQMQFEGSASDQPELRFWLRFFPLGQW